jgi:hypothetical protein
MTTIVWGHGSRSKGEEKTFVPAGTTVRWFSNVDENLLTNNGFLALETGDFGNATDTQGPGDGVKTKIYNYQVFEDLVKRDWVSMLHQGSGKLTFVGVEVPDQAYLCSTPQACERRGSHACEGLFSKIKDTEIVILVCRGMPGSDKSTQKYGSQPDPKLKTPEDELNPLTDTVSDMAGFVGGFMGRVRTDPDTAMAEYTELSNPVKIHLAPWPSIIGFQAAHWAAYYAATGDPDGAFRQLGEVAGDATNWGETTKLLQSVDVYRARFAQGAAAAPERFFALLDTAPGNVQTLIGGIGRVQMVRTEWEKQSQATADWQAEAASTWVPSESDLAGVAEINKKTVKDAEDEEELDYEVAGFVMLIGDNHPAEWYVWARGQKDHASGKLTVEKGGFRSKGSFEVTGCPMTKQGVVEAAIQAFSEKEVEFA